MIRARALVVLPDEDARLNLLGARIPNGKVDISTSVVPEIDISYFFTRNVAVELIAGVTRHKVKGAGALAGTPVGNTWLLPRRSPCSITSPISAPSSHMSASA